LKLAQGISALAIACVALLAGLALWEEDEPSARNRASARGIHDDSLPAAFDDSCADVLGDPLPEGKRTEAAAPSASRSVDLRLVPNENGVRVCGSVKLLDGACPIGTRVALFAKHSSEPDATPLHETACDENGIFCVSTDQAGQLALAVFAPGFRPATRLVEVSVGVVENLGEIALEPGAAIEGAVLADSEPQHGVELVAILASNGTVMRTSDASLRWTRGAFEWSFTTAKNDADGRYRISGLRADDYRVRITAMRGPDSVFGYKTLEAMDVEAPSTAVDFKLVTSNLELRLECDEQPLDAVSTELEANGVHLSRLSDECGVVQMRCLPNLQCNLMARKKGYRPQLIPMETPAAGRTRTETVELEPIVEPASLRVELDTGDGERVASARFALFAIDAQGHESLFRRSEVWPASTVISSSHDALVTSVQLQTSHPRRFVVENIPSGRYRIEIGAGKPIARSFSSQLSTYCFAEFLVSIPETGDVHQRVVLEPRGCVDVRAHDASGNPVSARFTLVAEDGSAVQVYRPVLAWDQSMAGETNLDNEGRARIYTAECGGSFVLELSFAGFVTRSVPVTVVPGAVSRVDVTVERE
jgi:hypothetical protein